MQTDEIQPKDIMQKTSKTSEEPILIIAPLQGYTDITFRNVFARHFNGINQTMAPFISTMGHQKIRESTLEDIKPENNILPVIPQMMGNDAEDLTFLSNRLFDLGHGVVNWNLGCPHTKIAKKKRGSGLLPYPERIDAILEEMTTNTKPELSIKLRIGYRSADEIQSLIPVLNQHDLSEIILHPRTGVQIYQGIPDLESFFNVYNQIKHKLTYNGDIVDKQSFDHIKRLFPQVKSFMLGRGLLANPFLGEEIKGIHIGPTNQKLERLYKFHGDLLKEYQKVLSGPAHVMNRMKGFWKFLGPSFEQSRQPLKKILKSKDTKTLTQRSDDLFDQCPDFSPLPSKILASNGSLEF